MSRVRWISPCLTLAISLGLAGSNIAMVQAEDRQVFRTPRIDGKQVDYCLNEGSGCGRPAADEFCRRAGFERAVSYVKRDNVASKANPTIHLGGGRLCASPDCDSFSAITCARAGTSRPAEKVTPPAPAPSRPATRSTSRPAERVTPPAPAPTRPAERISPDVERIPPNSTRREDLSRHLVSGFPARTSSASLVRSQGARNTCITFAATAALELELDRAGHGKHDLSEEFSNYLGKVFWLHQNWDGNASGGQRLADFDADRRENQVGAYGGGSGVGVLEALANGMRIPEERVMPYVKSDDRYTTREYTDPYWNSQRNTNDFNLHPSFLPPRALNAPAYYGIQGYRRLPDSQLARPAAYERILEDGHPIVVDFDVLGQRPRDGLWRYMGPRTNSAGERTDRFDSHAMLIVGYDRMAVDPRDHYFLAKNSWGPTGFPDGLTRIHYDYLKYVSEAGHITSVASPTRWPELRFLGIWNLAFDGHQGRLDIYHIPGMSQPVLNREGGGVRDRRIGTFYDAGGKAHRVNGLMSGSKLEFYIDSNEPNLRWDKLQGRRFEYFLVDDGKMLAGVHHDVNGDVWGGYARKVGFIGTPFAGRAVHPREYLTVWAMTVGNRKATVGFHNLNGPWLEGRLRYEGSSDAHPVTARLVSGSDNRGLTMSLPSTSTHEVVRVYRLSRQGDVAAGHLVDGGSGRLRSGVVMVRVAGSGEVAP